VRPEEEADDSFDGGRRTSNSLSVVLPIGGSCCRRAEAEDDRDFPTGTVNGFTSVLLHVSCIVFIMILGDGGDDGQQGASSTSCCCCCCSEL
jgi:hypothetical protein